VGTWYDPMLGKVIAHGPTRDAARNALIAALDDSAIFGVTTNLGFLRRLAASDAFRDAAIDAGRLDRHPDGLPAEAPELALCAAAWASAASPSNGDPFATGDGWRLGGPPAPIEALLETGDKPHVMQVDLAHSAIHEGERSWSVHRLASVRGRLRLEIDGAIHDFQVQVSPHAVTVGHHGQAHTFHRPEQFRHDATAEASDGSVLASMPGTVLSVAGKIGQPLRENQTVVVMEAMKMELSLAAPFEGTLARVEIAPGDQVPLGQILFEVVPHGQRSPVTEDQ
jgi:acetyl-CoA/propionyl-CoA carboxylase biotin carboxyl carrier protein